MKELITFKKQRELGDIITDTFKFIRLEYKPLFKALLRNAAIPFLILIGISAYYTGVTTDISILDNGSFSFVSFFLPALAMFIAMFFYYGVLYGTVLNYIKLYIDHQGTVDQDELKTHVRADLGSLTGITMTLTSIIAISVALFIVQSVSNVLTQIFTILIIGLAFDIINTWITNVSILKWHLEGKHGK